MLQQQMQQQNQILNSMNNNSETKNSANSSNNDNNDGNNIIVKFIIVTENNQSDKSNKIDMFIKKEEKMNEIYKRLLTKLITEDQNYIKKIMFQGNEIPKTSTQNAGELNFTNGCEVLAIKN